MFTASLSFKRIFICIHIIPHTKSEETLKLPKNKLILLLLRFFYKLKIKFHCVFNFKIFYAGNFNISFLFYTSISLFIELSVHSRIAAIIIRLIDKFVKKIFIISLRIRIQFVDFLFQFLNHQCISVKTRFLQLL